ncbi:hypothetical protein KVG96_21480 [Pseudomonas sp. COR58]|uniref:Uncharacterized protein n=1 Tax=Pseudomonas ekonensis TaxID=2842353 RepID=A0ABS6PJ89_9PSED|nr:hypothetical protein [Pseudomonas ekonensis]MBV4460533.1 hypothetical protein [Pseudomonas ekonensis]
MKEQYSAYANSGAIVLFPCAMDEQEKQDVQHSVLFAQLAANKKFPLTADPDDWYSIWQQVLKGQWLQRRVEWSTVTPGPGIGFKAMDGMIGVLRPALAEAGDWVPILQAVAALPVTDPAIAFLQERIRQPASCEGADQINANQRHRFLVVVAQPGPRLSAAYVTLTSAAGAEGNPYARTFSADSLRGPLEQRFFQADLAAPLFDPVRDTLAKRLEPHVDLIKAIDFSQPDSVRCEPAG